MPSWQPAAREAAIDRIAAHPIEGAPDEMRRRFRELVLGPAADAGGMPLTMRPTGAPRGTVVWFHGGGYVFGGPETHARIGRYLADAHGLVVHLPAYPLAPEHRWPAQRDAALAAIPDGPVVLAGDSAGGHLALVTALALARDGKPPAALLLFSPNTDRTGRSETRAAMDGDDPMVDDAGDRALAAMCFGHLPDDDPEVSPLLDDLSPLPPTWIEVGTPEVLLGDARLLAERAQAAGAEVHLTVTPDLLHMAQVWAPDWDAATDSLDRAAAFALSKLA